MHANKEEHVSFARVVIAFFQSVSKHKNKKSSLTGTLILGYLFYTTSINMFSVIALTFNR